MRKMDFLTYLHDDIHTKMDRVSMSVSLETRVPLLSNDIIDYAFRLDDSVVLMNNELKGVLKAAYQNILPRSILYRAKKGFSVPKEFYMQSQRIDEELSYILSKFS